MKPTTSALVEEELQLRSRDQTGLYVRRVRPEGTARGRLAWVHGVAEHGERYRVTLRWFAERGFDCSILDLRGHGNSGGRRVYVSRWSDYHDDMQAFFGHLQRESFSGPTFALGHSMGGLVLAGTLQERQGQLGELKGAVLFSPFFSFKLEVPAWKALLGNTLSRFLPWASVPTDLNPADLSKDPSVGEAYLADPTVTKAATTRWFTEVQVAQRAALAQAHALRLPILSLHGEEDALADIEGTRTFHAQLGSADKELREWPGMRHELLNEVEQEEIRTSLLEWLEARLGDG